MMQVLLFFTLFSSVSLQAWPQRFLNPTDNLLQQGIPASLPVALSLRHGIDENANIVPMKVNGEIGGHYVELEGTIQVRFMRFLRFQLLFLFPLLTMNMKFTHKH